ncbi:unnamed protein product [Calicophoron daubneyi]|uniref:Uncharacterized protein n=1 Tax=Calicophoron daubneyi TaxID=300641 RepID=A0AAV2T114_CALDB
MSNEVARLSERFNDACDHMIVCKPHIRLLRTYSMPPSFTLQLKQLDIVSAEDSVPPPWIAKLSGARPTTNGGGTHSVDKSWSTVGTQDSPFSPRSPDIISTCLTDQSTCLSMSRNNGNILSSMSPSESSVESGEEGQQKRTSKLSEVLAELNAFAESIILPSVEQPGEKGVDQDAHISESRRRILSQLTSMCDEEEEEEDITDPEIQANQQTSGQESVKIMDHNSSDSGVSAICVPLPPTCRVSSPMRLLVCYFEILSELADLKAEASKEKLERQREWSVLADLAAALLRVLVTPSVPRRGQTVGAADRFNCGFGLRALIRLRDILTMAPVVDQECSLINPQHLGSRRIVNIYSEQINLALEQHRLWLRALTERELRDQRESMTGPQLCSSAGDYKKRIEVLIGRVLSRLDKVNMSQLFDEIHNSLSQSELFDTENHLMSLPPPELQNVSGKHSADISNGDDESPKSVYSDRNSELWTQLLKCCTNEVNSLVTYVSQPWVPVQQWSENLYLDSGENRLLTIAEWQKNELAGWCEQRMTIQDGFRCLGKLPDLLESAELTCSKNKSNDQTRNLVNNMRSFYDQMLDRCSKLRLFECLVRLPGGVCSSLKALTELSSRLRLHEFENLGDCELCLRQIQHQLCTELAFLRSLFDPEPNKPTSLEPESNWVPLWTEQMSNAYSAVVSAWEERVIQLKQLALKDAFDVWVGCADLCLRAISDTPNLCSPEYLLGGESPFPVLWNLLCDAELLQETYWRIHQCTHIKTTLKKLPLPELFTPYLNAIGNHVEFAIAACKRETNLIPMLLQQLEHSQRENRTQVVCQHIAEAMNDGYTSETTDKLRFLTHDLRYCQWLWERRLHLTIKSINLAGEPSFRGSAHGQFVQHWVESMCLRRDWQSRIMKALERIVRAAEVVDAERFPLRPIQTFETRFDQKELLSQEQTFIEAVHFGLEVIQLETNVLRTGLSVCDSQIAGSPLSSSLNSKLEELKHLYSRMIHDPRLGQSGSTCYPRSRLTMYIDSRKQESLKLYGLIRSVMSIDWKLGNGNEADTEWHRRTPALLSMDECLDWLDTLMTNNGRHESIQKSARNLEQCIAEIQSLKFKKYNVGFSWTPISFNVELLMNQMPQDSSDEIDRTLLDTCAHLREQLKRQLVPRVDRNGRISLPPQDYRGKESGGQGMRLKSETKHRTCLPAEKECLCKQRINQAVLTSTFAELEAKLKDPTKEMHLLEVANILFDLLQHRIPENRTQPDLHRLWSSAYFSAVLRVRMVFWKATRNREALSELLSALNTWVTQKRASENGTTANGTTVLSRSENNGLSRPAASLSDFSDFIVRLQTLSIILSSWCTTFDTTNCGRYNPVGSCEQICELRQLLENLINLLPTQLVPFCSECVCSKIEEFLTTNEADLDTLVSDDKITVASSTTPNVILFHPALRTRMEKMADHMEFALSLLEAANPPPPENKKTETAGESVSCLFDAQITMDSCLLNRLKADVKLLQNYLSMDRQARALMHQARDILHKMNNRTPTGNGASECADAEGDLVKLTLLEKQLKAVNVSSDNGSPNKQITPNMIELIFLRHQLSLAQQYSKERLAAHDYTTSAPATKHQKLERCIMDSMATVEQMIRRFASLLNTHSSWSDKELIKLAYELRLQLPTEADIAWLYAQLTSLEKLHDELKFSNDSGNEYFPSVFDELDQCDLIESGGESSVYLTDMLHQLHSTVLSSEAVDRKLKMLNEQSHRLRDLAGALSDHMHEVKSAEQQLYLAVPNLMGQHMDELARAVDELESEASDGRTNSSGTMDPLRECPQLSENITHAGQRLMELETSLEHASETVRILILLSRGANLWGHFGSVGLEDPAQSIHERNAALQSEYEQSFMCTRLRSAWGRLAQLGDRLGRIQAGLPARSPVDRKDEKADATFINENANSLPPLISAATDEDRRSLHTSEPRIDVAPAPEIDAETIRRKRLNLHDMLGSHSCVYPECKRAREEWMAFGFPASTDQMSIDEKVRRIFVDLVHFYTRLQKNLIERSGLEPQKSPGSRPTGQVDQSPRHQNWHSDPDLVAEYHELMARVQDVLSCSLPQVNKLRMKANSLRKLWLGRSAASGPGEPASVEQFSGVGRRINYSPEDDTFKQSFAHYPRPLELPHSDSGHLLSDGRSPNAAAPLDFLNGLDHEGMVEEASAPDNFERPWREIVDVDEQIKPVHLPFLSSDVPAAKPRKKSVPLSTNDGNPHNLNIPVRKSSRSSLNEDTLSFPEEPSQVGPTLKQLPSGDETQPSTRKARGQFSKRNEAGQENEVNGECNDNSDFVQTNTESTSRQSSNRHSGTTGKDENMAKDATVQVYYDLLLFSDVYTQTEDSVEITVARPVEQNSKAVGTAPPGTMNPRDQETNPVSSSRSEFGATNNHGQTPPSSSESTRNNSAPNRTEHREAGGSGEDGNAGQIRRPLRDAEVQAGCDLPILLDDTTQTENSDEDKDREFSHVADKSSAEIKEPGNQRARVTASDNNFSPEEITDLPRPQANVGLIAEPVQGGVNEEKLKDTSPQITEPIQSGSKQLGPPLATSSPLTETEVRDTMAQMSPTDDQPHLCTGVVNDVAGGAGLLWYDAIDSPPKMNLTRHQSNAGDKRNMENNDDRENNTTPVAQPAPKEPVQSEANEQTEREGSQTTSDHAEPKSELTGETNTGEREWIVVKKKGRKKPKKGRSNRGGSKTQSKHENEVNKPRAVVHQEDDLDSKVHSVSPVKNACPNGESAQNANWSERSLNNILDQSDPKESCSLQLNGHALPIKLDKDTPDDKGLGGLTKSDQTDEIMATKLNTKNLSVDSQNTGRKEHSKDDVKLPSLEKSNVERERADLSNDLLDFSSHSRMNEGFDVVDSGTRFGESTVNKRTPQPSPPQDLQAETVPNPALAISSRNFDAEDNLPWGTTDSFNNPTLSFNNQCPSRDQTSLATVTSEVDTKDRPQAHKETEGSKNDQKTPGLPPTRSGKELPEPFEKNTQLFGQDGSSGEATPTAENLGKDTGHMNQNLQIKVTNLPSDEINQRLPTERNLPAVKRKILRGKRKLGQKPVSRSQPPPSEKPPDDGLDLPKSVDDVSRFQNKPRSYGNLDSVDGSMPIQNPSVLSSRDVDRLKYSESNYVELRTSLASMKGSVQPKLKDEEPEEAGSRLYVEVKKDQSKEVALIDHGTSGLARLNENPLRPLTTGISSPRSEKEDKTRHKTYEMVDKIGKNRDGVAKVESAEPPQELGQNDGCKSEDLTDPTVTNAIHPELGKRGNEVADSSTEKSIEASSSYGQSHDTLEASESGKSASADEVTPKGDKPTAILEDQLHVESPKVPSVTKFMNVHLKDLSKDRPGTPVDAANDVTAGWGNERLGEWRVHKPKVGEPSEESKSTDAPEGDSARSTKTNVPFSGGTHLAIKPAADRDKEIRPSEIAGISTASLKPAASEEQSSESLSTRIESKEIISTRIPHQKPDFSASVYQFDSSMADGDSRKSHAAEEPSEHLFDFGKTVQGVVTSSATADETGVLKDRLDTEPVVYDTAEELYRTKSGRKRISEKEWVQKEPEGSHVSISDRKAIGLRSTERDREKPSRRGEGDWPTLRSRRQKCGEISGAMRNEPKGTEQSVEEIPGPLQSHSDEFKDQSSRDKNENEGLVQDLPETTLEKKEEDDESDEHKRLMEDLGLNEEHVVSERSCCRRLITMLALLLFLLTVGLFLYCLLFVPTCGLSVGWSRDCPEETWLLKHLYYPLMTLRTRRPPL